MWRQAPPWVVSHWFNVDPTGLPRSSTPESTEPSQPPSLEALRGQVVLLLAFQLHCRGCVERALPQVREVAESFDGAPLTVVGLHTVFEGHATARPHTLQRFLQDQRIHFPVGVDAHDPTDPEGKPRTFAAYAMTGTPTLVLLDGWGRIRRQTLGTPSDLRLGADVGLLLGELAQRREG